MKDKQEITATPNNYTVYVHETPNGKRYVGITSLEPENRWARGHGYAHNEHFMKAIKKYGWDNIRHTIIENGLTEREAETAERKYIKEFRSNDRAFGYNLTDGGERGKRHSEESKRKMSEKQKGRPSLRKGTHMTPEARARASEAHKGLRYNIGVPFTEERKQHLRENHADVRGEKNPNFGKKWTPEQIAIRQEHRGEYPTGGEHPSARPILQLAQDGELVRRWGSLSEASKEYCRTSIKYCLRGKYKQHRGFIWRYEENGKQD